MFVLIFIICVILCGGFKTGGYTFSGIVHRRRFFFTWIYDEEEADGE